MSLPMRGSWPNSVGRVICIITNGNRNEFGDEFGGVSCWVGHRKHGVKIRDRDSFSLMIKHLHSRLFVSCEQDWTNLFNTSDSRSLLISFCGSCTGLWTGDILC